MTKQEKKILSEFPHVALMRGEHNFWSSYGWGNIYEIRRKAGCFYLYPKLASEGSTVPFVLACTECGLLILAMFLFTPGIELQTTFVHPVVCKRPLH